MRIPLLFLTSLLVGGAATTAIAQPTGHEHDVPHQHQDPDPQPRMRCGMSNATRSDAVTFFGDWPPSTCCNFSIAPGRETGPPFPECDNNISGVDVPFGMSAEICQFGGEQGKCRTFLPGRTFVGADMNDIASWFKVSREMIAYINSSWFPTGFTVAIGVTGHDPGVGPLGPFVSVGYDGTWITQSYNVTLPASCPQPTFRPTTQNGDAQWSKDVRSSVATITLKIKPTALFGANNWVGVQMACPNNPAAQRKKG